MRSGERYSSAKYAPSAVPLRKTIRSAEYQRSIVEKPKRVGAPVVGCRQVRWLSAAMALASPPLGGGAANRWPITEKRV